MPAHWKRLSIEKQAHAHHEQRTSVIDHVLINNSADKHIPPDKALVYRTSDLTPQGLAGYHQSLFFCYLFISSLPKQANPLSKTPPDLLTKKDFAWVMEWEQLK